MMTAKEVIQRFQLEPLVGEGGYYRQNYQSGDILRPAKLCPERYPVGSVKPLYTAITYLVTPDSFSSLHRLPTDEVYHFYLGDPIRLLLLPPDGDALHVTLGQDVLNGMEVQFTVPAGWWQGSSLVSGGSWGLVGTTMAPGYTSDDYEPADALALIRRFPECREEILKLTHHG